jgi:hypothetical protein
MADLESIATNAGALAALGFTAYQSFRSRREAAGAKSAARGAAVSANLAAVRSEPTSNGYAQSTRDSLDRIEGILMDHLVDHARARVKKKGRRR